jgi:AraC-like DNA-binding protein
MSLPKMLDVAASESFETSRLLRGDLARVASEAAEPQRRRRGYRRVDHQAVAKRLEEALRTGEKLSDIASDLGASVATLARHTDLYDEVRDALEHERDIIASARRQAAVNQVEGILLTCLQRGMTPSLRNAGRITGDVWHVGQLRSVSLVMLRIMLGDARVKPAAWQSSMGWEHRRLLEASAERIRRATTSIGRQSQPLRAA